MACPTGKLQVDSKDPRINYNLLPGEKLITCPYDKAHAVRPIKFAKHVLNCHRLHCKAQQAKNASSLFTICQYDRSHHVPNELIASHYTTCAAKGKEDDWEYDWDDGKPEVKTEAVVKSEAPSDDTKVFQVAPLPPPPAYDDETKRVMEEAEDWGEEESTHARFDPDDRIHNLRMNGYKVVKGYKFVGKTKSEKKALYEAEKEAFTRYDKESFLDRMKGSGASTSGSVASTSSNGSCATVYGYEADRDMLGPINEEF